MSKAIIFLFSLIFFTLFPSFSQPELFDEYPKNGTYIYGKDNDVFSIKAISSLSIEGYLYVRVKDPTSIWKEIKMNCFQEENYWICNTTVPGLEALLAEGKYLLYYFTASNSYGKSFYGNESSPLEVLVDRSPPLISLAFPYSNLTYVSDRKKLSFIINDTLSGVNLERVEVLFSYGNETWNSSWIKMIFDNQTNTFIAPWNTSLLPNNSSWIVYVNASDNVGNYNVTKIGVFYVDNEEPRIIEYRPRSYEGIWGGTEVYVKGEDRYSGLNRLEISILDFFDYVYCSKNECRYILDTLKFSDGNYTLNLTLYDNAENFYTVLIPVKIDNTYPTLSLEYPSEYLKGIVNFTLKIGNVREIKKSIVKISTSTWSSEYELNCYNFVCNFILDTKSYHDGKYLITFSITNEVGYISSYSKEFIFDNTLPIVMGSEPIYENFTLKLSFGILDEVGVNINLSKIKVNEEILKPNCRVLTEGKRALCEISVEKNLTDGRYDVIFYGYDLAENENSDKKVLIVGREGSKPHLEENIPSVLNKSVEEKEKSKGIISFEKIGEILKSGSSYFILILGIIFFSLFLFLRLFFKPILLLPKITFSIRKDLDSLLMVEKYLQMNGENILEEKTYLLNARKILEDISDISSLSKSFNQILQILPVKIKEKLVESFSKKIKEMEKRESLITLKKELDKIVEISDLSEIRKRKKYLFEIFEKCKKELEREMEIAQEIEKLIGENK